MPALSAALEERFSHGVMTYVDSDGYPMSVATSFEVAGDVLRLGAVHASVAPKSGTQVNVIFSHIRPQPGIGYDERRYACFLGPVTRPRAGGFELRPASSYGWDEQELPFVAYSENSVPQAHGYLADLSRRLGRPVKPRLSRGWLFLRTTRLPFVSATAVSVFLGAAVAAAHGVWHWTAAVWTLVAAICIHLGLNMANDVFDTRSGADQANNTPTQFSGGSRVVQYGLVSMRSFVALCAGFYLAGIGIGLWLAISHHSWTLFWIGLTGVVISLVYTAPPLRLVHHGLGEVAVAAGFGPVVTLGAYVVQTGRLSWEAFYASLPVAILIALVLYVNEIPDRRGDAAVGKRTLPVRASKQAVIAGYRSSVVAAYGLIVAGAVSGLTPFATIAALATIPMAVKVHRGLDQHYDDPYALMPFMGLNVMLHGATTVVMVAGYGVAIVAGHLMHAPPAILR